MSGRTFGELIDTALIGRSTALRLAGDAWTVGGADCRRLAREHGTPLFLLDEERVRAACREVLAAFAGAPGGAALRYAVKACSAPAVLRAVRECGLGVEVASEQELAAALEAGHLASRILVNGNAKSDAQISAAIAAGVEAVVADCAEELERIEALAAGQRRRVPVALRIAPGHGEGFWGMAGVTSKFGTPAAQAPAVFRRIRERLHHLEPAGLHCHAGSQLTSPGVPEATVDALVDLAAGLRDEGTAIRFLDIGGGFPVRSLFWSDYTPSGPRAPRREELLAEFDLPETGRRVTRRLAERLAERGLPPLPLVVEPGGAIVKGAGVLLTSVQVTKGPAQPGLPAWVAVDAGCHTLPDCWIYDWFFECLPLDTTTYGEPLRRCNVAGPLCDPGDVLARDRLLPELRRGALLAFLQPGGYQAEMQCSFPLLPRAPLVVVPGGSGRVDQPLPKRG